MNTRAAGLLVGQVVGQGVTAYVRDLAVSPPVVRVAAVRRGKRWAQSRHRSAIDTQTGESGAVDVGSVLSFVAGVSRQEQQDVLYSVQLAQRAASGAFDRFTEVQSWYRKYMEVLENLGWVGERLAFTDFDQEQGELRMDQAALKIITAIAPQNQLAVLKASIDALGSLAEDDKTIQLFDFHSSLESSGNFQLGSVQKANGALSMAVGAFYFRALDERRRFLFFKWGHKKVHFWTAAQRMVLNTEFYAKRRDAVKEKLADGADYVSGLRLG